MNESSSLKLLEQLRLGSDSAESEIDRRYRGRVIALARSRLMEASKRADPEDIAQETMWVLFDKLADNSVKWDQPGDLWRLLAGITLNKIRKSTEYFSAGKRSHRVEQSSNSVELSAVDIELASIELGDSVDSLIANEKPLAKRIFQLRLAGENVDAIAKEVSRNEKTVRRILNVLRSKILSSADFDTTRFERGDDSKSHPGELEHAAGARWFEFNEITLLQYLGGGSFSKVYVALDHRNNNRVAVKVLRDRWVQDLDVRKRFEHEVQVLSGFNSASIVKLIGHGLLKNDAPYMVLELLKPYSPWAGIGSDNGEKSILQIRDSDARFLKSALALVHQHGLLHGDLKISNILQRANGRPVLADFGLSRVSREEVEREAEHRKLDRILKEVGIG